jgi:excisionase family DNA binding protein
VAETLLDAEQVAARLGIRRRRVYSLVEARDPTQRLPVVRIGKRTLRFDPRAIERWLEERAS